MEEKLARFYVQGRSSVFIFCILVECVKNFWEILFLYIYNERCIKKNEKKKTKQTSKTKKKERPRERLRLTNCLYIFPVVDFMDFNFVVSISHQYMPLAAMLRRGRYYIYSDETVRFYGKLQGFFFLVSQVEYSVTLGVEFLSFLFLALSPLSTSEKVFEAIYSLSKKYPKVREILCFSR